MTRIITWLFILDRGRWCVELRYQSSYPASQPAFVLTKRLRNKGNFVIDTWLHGCINDMPVISYLSVVKTLEL